MSDEEGGMGIGTVVAVVLVVIGLLLVASTTLYGFFPKVKDAFKGFVGEPGELQSKYNEIVNKEEVQAVEEKERADKVFNIFKGLDLVKEKDCVQRLKFYELNDKEFTVKVEGKEIKVIRGIGRAVFSYSLRNDFIFLNDEKEVKNFFIRNKLSEIDGIKLGDYVYKKDKLIYFLDEVKSEDLSGKYSPVFSKKKCGEEKEEVKLLEISSEKTSALNALFGMEEVNKLVLQLFYLNIYEGYDTIKLKLLENYEKKLREKILDYFSKEEVECWRLSVKLKLGGNYKTYEYGGLGEDREFNLYHAVLKEDEPKDPRIIAESSLFGSKSC